MKGLHSAQVTGQLPILILTATESRKEISRLHRREGAAPILGGLSRSPYLRLSFLAQITSQLFAPVIKHQPLQLPVEQMNPSMIAFQKASTPYRTP